MSGNLALGAITDRDTNIIGSKFMLHYKHDDAGNIGSRKARLVAQGFTQAEGIDYNETFSPTAKLSAICIITVITAHNGWELEQMDIDGAYLNTSLKETIYMRQLKGYEVLGKEHLVCKLEWALYSLKQARREWYNHFLDTMLNSDSCDAKQNMLYSIAMKMMMPLSLLSWMTSQWPAA